jgi:hypothetical protein
MVIGFIGSVLNPPKPKTRAEIEADSLRTVQFEAQYQCERFVEASLKAPATAKFGNERAWVVKNKPGHWSASGYVDAQNSFGALIRTTFGCDMSRDRNGDWRLLKIFTAP